MTGSNPAFHPRRLTPLTVRERARIQGFPDDFLFYSEKLNEDGTWNHDKNMILAKQTGKAMPIQFNRYVAQHIKNFLDSGGVDIAPDFTTGERVIKPSSYIDDAKQWYCKNVGYSCQQDACEVCWLRPKCDLKRKV